MAKFGTMEFSVAFQPTSAFPLDARSYFDSYAAAEAAALTAKEAGSTNSIYYIGEPIVVVENGKAQQYIIQTDLTLSAIGGSVDTSALEARIDEVAALVGERVNADAGTEATGIFKDLSDLALETDTKIDNAISKKFAEITDNGKIDTIMELIKYVDDHGSETEQIVSDIDALKALVGDVSVQEQIIAILTERNILGKDDNDLLYIKGLFINEALCEIVNGHVNIVSDELTIDENGKLAILSVAPEKVTGLSDLMASGQRLITKDEIDKLAGLILNEDGSVESSGQINMSGVIGLEEALDKKIDGIMLGGIAAEIVDKVAQIPTATTEKLGLVKSAAVDAETGAVAQNGVVVAEDGTMSVASLNVDRLVQDESSYLILNGGSAQ